MTQEAAVPAVTEPTAAPLTEAARQAAMVAGLAATFKEDRAILKRVAAAAGATLPEVVAWHTMGAAVSAETQLAVIIRWIQAQQQRQAAVAASMAGLAGGPQLWTPPEGP